MARNDVIEEIREVERPEMERRYRGVVERIASLAGLLLIFLAGAILVPSFLTPFNLLNVLRQSCINALLASGQTFVILTAGIELSVGSLLALSGVVAASLMAEDALALNPILASLIALMITTLAGLWNGLWIIQWRFPSLEQAIKNSSLPGWLQSVLITLTNKTEVPPFIVTLSMMLVARGVTYILSQGQPRMAPKSFGWIGQGYLGPIPVPVILTLLIYLLCYFILVRTKFGRAVYAIGGNEEVARLSGIKVNRVKLGVYVLCAFLAAVAGLVAAARMGSGQPNVGQGYELDAIAAVVIGGTSLFGGEGGIWGTLIGALIIALLLNILNLLGVSAYWQFIVRGLVILVAVYIDTSIRR